MTIDDGAKPTRDFNPRLRKDRDNTRQRKIVSNGSDKAARQHEVRIKTSANRVIRRQDKVTLDVHGADFEPSADAIRQAHRMKPKHWGTKSAEKHREVLREYRDEHERDAERDQGTEE